MKPGSRADEIVCIGNDTALHLVQQVHQLPSPDVIEVNHDCVQKTSILTVTTLAVVTDRGEKHESVL